MCKVCFIVILYALFNTLYHTVRVKVYGVIQGCCKIERGGVDRLKISITDHDKLISLRVLTTSNSNNFTLINVIIITNKLN
jgi:hypothetical protein